MRAFLLITTCLLLATVNARGQTLKHRLFKVDPMGAAFKELRVSVEHRIHKDYFAWLSPYGYHQLWMSRDRERYGRPDFPQKYYGLGFRLGARRYFIPRNMSPQGFFVHAMTGFRMIGLNNMDENLTVISKTHFRQYCFGGVVGYQMITGPDRNFAYGIIGGFEQFFFTRFPRGSGFDNDIITRNWFEFPFLGDGLRGFRLYLGVEVGFVFLQKHLHW